MKRYLAIDIGASSGRHVVGWRENGELVTKEVFRFPNGVREGIDKALVEFGKIESFAIDTWGVDYVLMRGDESIPA